MSHSIHSNKSWSRKRGHSLSNGSQADPGQLRLFLFPLNNTFERKDVILPLFPKTIRVGRQTNKITTPNSSNVFFDSKVLSRQHAELWCQDGKAFIKDIKSSNGTFVNGHRLSPENAESPPTQLHIDDILELGIDIINEDDKSVMHRKVTARVANISDLSDHQPANHQSTRQEKPEQPAGITIETLMRKLTADLKTARSVTAQLRLTSDSFQNLQKDFFLDTDEKDAAVAIPTLSNVLKNAIRDQSPARPDLSPRDFGFPVEPKSAEKDQSGPMVANVPQRSNVSKTEQRVAEKAPRRTEELTEDTQELRIAPSKVRETPASTTGPGDTDPLSTPMAPAPEPDNDESSLSTEIDRTLHEKLRTALQDIEKWKTRAELAEKQVKDQKDEIERIRSSKSPSNGFHTAQHGLDDHTEARNYQRGLSHSLPPFYSAAGVVIAGLSTMWIINAWSRKS